MASHSFTPATVVMDSSMAADVTTRVDGRTLTLSNLDKVLYPASATPRPR